MQTESTALSYQDNIAHNNSTRAYTTVQVNSKMWRKLSVWIAKHMSQKQFILLLALLVGVGAAVAAQVLKFLIHEIEHILTSQFDVTHANWLFLVYPIVGIYLTALFIKYIVRDDIGHGVTKYSMPFRANKETSRGTTAGRVLWPQPSPLVLVVRSVPSRLLC